MPRIERQAAIGRFASRIAKAVASLRVDVTELQISAQHAQSGKRPVPPMPKHQVLVARLWLQRGQERTWLNSTYRPASLLRGMR